MLLCVAPLRGRSPAMPPAIRSAASVRVAALAPPTATPPRSVMNSRRRMSDPKLRRRHVSGSNEYFDRGGLNRHQNHCRSAQPMSHARSFDAAAYPGDQYTTSAFGRARHRGRTGTRSAISVVMHRPSSRTGYGRNAPDIIETVFQRRSIAPRFAVSHIPDGAQRTSGVDEPFGRERGLGDHAAIQCKDAEHIGVAGDASRASAGWTGRRYKTRFTSLASSPARACTRLVSCTPTKTK